MKQKGFTLIEILVVMLVGGMVMAAALSTTSQIVVGTDRTNSQVVALADINQAVLALKKDLMMTQSSNLTDDDPIPQSSATLSWTDYTAFGDEVDRTHISAYTLSGTNLQRTYDGTTYIVGRNISSIGFTRSGRVISVVITATGPGAAKKGETLRFTAYRRSEELQ